MVEIDIPAYYGHIKENSGLTNRCEPDWPGFGRFSSPRFRDLTAATFMVVVALLCAIAWIAAALLAARYAPPCGPQDISTISGVRLPNCGPFTFNTKSNLVTGATK